MAVSLITFGGQDDGSGAFSTTFGTQNALFAKKIGGEILTEFRQLNVFERLHMTKTIRSGKSAKFPVFGTAATRYFTPGTDVALDSDAESNKYMSNIKRGERVINVNDLLLASCFVDQLDELKDEYETRQIYVAELAGSLVDAYDSNVIRAILAAAAGSAAVTGGPAGGGDVQVDLLGGSDVTDQPADIQEEGKRIAGGIYDAVVKLKDAKVPGSDIYCALSPTHVSYLARSLDAINKDWGGAGSYADGKVLRIGGAQIVESTNIPSTNETSSQPGGENNTLYTNQSTTIGAVWHKSAAATVKLMDLGFETEYNLRLQGYPMISKMAVGHGLLRPEAAVRLVSI